MQPQSTSLFNIECAFYRDVSRPFVLPILEGGMLVRDFAAYIRDTFCIPPTASVILCDAVTCKPHRGLHWLLPNTALQIQVNTVTAPMSVATTPAISSGKLVDEEATFDDDENDSDNDNDNGNVIVSAYLDSIVTAEGHGIGGISIVSLNTQPAHKDTSPIVFPCVENITTSKACDLHFFLAAKNYVKARFGKRVVVHFYCASAHITNACPTAHFVVLDTPELTQIRKKCVSSYSRARA